MSRRPLSGVVRTVMILTLLLGVGAAPAVGQDAQKTADAHGTQDVDDVEHVGADGEHDGAHIHGHHEHSPNHVALFVGVTFDTRAGGDPEEPSGTIGADYDRRLNRTVGIGFLAEYLGGQRREYVAMVPLSFRVGRQSRIITGIGFEGHGAGSLLEGEGELLLRVGYSYSFQVVPGNTIAPEISVDFVDDSLLVVVGAKIGWGF